MTGNPGSCWDTDERLTESYRIEREAYASMMEYGPRRLPSHYVTRSNIWQSAWRRGQEQARFAKLITEAGGYG